MKKAAFFTAFALLALSSSPALANSFPDVSEKHLNAQAVEVLKEEGTISGYPDGNFRTENRIQRDELVKLVVESIATDEEIQACDKDLPYSDVTREDWSYHHLCVATEKKLVSGYPDGTFRLADKVNFAEEAKIISNAFNLTQANENQTEWYKDYILALDAKEAIPSSIHSFGVDPTRGETSEMLYRLKKNVTDKPSPSYATLSAELPTVSSCEDLKEKFQVYPHYVYPPMPFMMEGDIAMDAEQSAAPSLANAPSTTALGGSVKSAEDFSSTNLQVEGVDEADIVKNDGKYIYWAKNSDQTVRVINAYPAGEMKELAKIEFDAGFNPQEMFLTKNRLMVIGQMGYGPILYMDAVVDSKMIMPPYYYQGPRTKVYVFNVENPAKPIQEREVTYESNYTTARLIGENLYLVLNASPYGWDWYAAKDGKDLLPFVKDGENEAEPAVACNQVHFLPGYNAPQYMLISGFNFTDAKSKISREVVLGSTDNVYVSPTDLFVAAHAWPYERYTDANAGFDEVRTNIFRFGLNDGKVNFEKRGSVLGTILNQFSMDQNGDYFRIATTQGETWNNNKPSTNHVSILDDNMQVIGKVDDIAPGERIYSTRFMGDRLYMVTFRQVDPFFVIDLKDARHPKVLGNLKVPGFSTYLHPYDANHIIGFGQSTEESKEGNVTTAGMKMAMFDVTDVTQPKQQFMEEIGDQGTYSELLYNHKALLFDKEKKLLAFPIQIVEKIDTASLMCIQKTYSTCPTGCQAQCVPTCTKNAQGVVECKSDCEGLGSCIEPKYPVSQTTFSGAIVYSVDLENGFKERGRMTNYTPEDFIKMGDYFPYDYHKEINRIIYIGEYLYGLSQGFVNAATLDKVNPVKQIQLEEVMDSMVE